ncbi:MAG: hypothetical protein L3J91_02745, partial [Thermoplasmata archaeon]|nr:hypothetical protein [Thermoplasmata archaeon]
MRPPRPWRTSDSTLRSGVIVVAFVALMGFVVVGAGAGPSHAGTAVTPPPVERSADLASKGSLVLDPAVGPAGFGSTLSGWSQITVGPHPSGRGTPAMAFDPLDNYTLLFSGGWSGGAGTNDTWTFHNGAWN